MSIPVDLADLDAQIAGFGGAYLLSVDEGHAPRVRSVLPGLHHGTFTVTVGARAARSIAANPRVTLLWPAPPGATFALIVDGTAAVDTVTVTVTPVWAVLHQTAAADPPRRDEPPTAGAV